MSKQLEKIKRTESKKDGWLNLLFMVGSKSEYEKIKEKSHSELFAMCKYKKILRDQGYGKIDITIIKKQHENNDIIGLHNSINSLFLEYYTEREIDNLLKLMKETKTTITEIYNRHIKRPEATILSHLNM